MMARYRVSSLYSWSLYDGPPRGTNAPSQQAGALSLRPLRGHCPQCSTPALVGHWLPAAPTAGRGVGRC
jgi:hypothetical protein